MKRSILASIVVGVCCFLFFACGESPIYHQYQNIDLNTGWSKDSVLLFKIPVKDTLATYRVRVEVRNTADYSYENLWLYAQTNSLDSISEMQSIDIPLADPQGNWYGRRWGSYYTTQMLIYDHLQVRNTQLLEIKIQQGIRETNLKGIAAIGIFVEQVPN